MKYNKFTHFSCTIEQIYINNIIKSIDKRKPERTVIGVEYPQV